MCSLVQSRCAKVSVGGRPSPHTRVPPAQRLHCCGNPQAPLHRAGHWLVTQIVHYVVQSWAWTSRKNEPRLKAQQACLLCLLPTSQSKSSLTGGEYQSSGSCPMASSWSSPQMRGLELVSDLLWPCHSPNYSFSDSPGPGGSVLAPQVISKEQRNSETAWHLLPNLTLFPNTGPPENDQLTATHSHPYGPSPSASPSA